MKNRFEKQDASNVSCVRIPGGYIVTAQVGRYRPQTFFNAINGDYYSAKLRAKSFIRNNYDRKIHKSYA